MLRAWLALLLLGLPSTSTGAAAEPGPPRPRADLVLIHGIVLTVDARDSVAQAIAMRDGHILDVGTDAKILALLGPHTLVIDLHGRTATPGMIDTHGHYAEVGASHLYSLDLRDATSIPQIAAMVRSRARTAKPGAWITGVGWYEQRLAERRYIHAADLDAASPNNPVWLLNTTGHYGVANSYALRLAHLGNGTPDPPQGTLDRDARGRLTGVLKESALMRVLALIPPPTYRQIEDGILHESEGMHREGITAVKDIGTAREWQAYRQLQQEGRLPLRVCMLWRAGNTLASARQALAGIREASAGPHTSAADRLIACGAKIFMDGSAIGRTGWSYQPWSQGEQPDGANTGYPAVDPQLYRRQVRLFHAAGISVGTHAIGDRAIDWVVDSYAEDMKQHPAHGLRDSIIHSYLPTPHAIATMAMLQHQYDTAYPEVQPAFLYWLGAGIAGSVDRARRPTVMPLRSYQRAAVQWASGSDYDVIPYAPRYGLFAAVTRQTEQGSLPFAAAEAVDIHAALRSYTASAARQIFLEQQVGSLEPGKHADIAVWDRNPYAIPAAELKDMHCELTLLDGIVVYRDANSPVTIRTGAALPARTRLAGAASR